MVESVCGLGFLCICKAGKHHGNTKQIQTNSLRAFGGGLKQGIDGKLGMRRVWLKCQRHHVFVYPYAQERLQKHETSSNELVSWTWRQFDAGNQWDVG